MEDKVCKYCIHFRQHYIRRSRGNFFPLLYGHCAKPRLKKRYANDKACPYWRKNADLLKIPGKV